MALVLWLIIAHPVSGVEWSGGAATMPICSIPNVDEPWSYIG